ncbi:MAG: hypothetical protein ACXWC9_07395 [Pseudobdellovibrionaceae bacterium]
MKYAFLYAGLIGLVAIFLIGLQIKMNTEILSHIENPDIQETISKMQNLHLFFQGSVMFLSALLIFFITITMTHRFMGPIIPLIRFFETLRTTGAAKPIALRGEDELEPLITYLNSVEIKVSKKD